MLILGTLSYLKGLVSRLSTMLSSPSCTFQERGREDEERGGEAKKGGREEDDHVKVNLKQGDQQEEDP